MSKNHVYVTTPIRVGSTWLCDILARLMKVNWVPLRYHNNDVSLLVPPQVGLLIKMHFVLPVWLCDKIDEHKASNVRVVMMWRDERDTIVSRLFYVRYDQYDRFVNSGTVLQRRARELADLDDRGFVNAFIASPEIKIITDELDLYRLNGFAHPRLMQVTYEDMHGDTVYTVHKVADFIGLKVSDVKIERAVADCSFAAVTARQPGDGDNRAFRRKGIVGDWENWLSDESLERLKEMKACS